MRRHTFSRLGRVLLVAGSLVIAALPRVGYAAAPDVRVVTPARIAIDGSNGDWDSQNADYLADLYTAGKPDKPVLAKLYGRYDCGSRTMYVHVVAMNGWQILPSNDDNYVKLGPTDKLVDGNDPPGGNPPSFAYIQAKAWEAAYELDPGSYLGEGGLNVHAQVQPDNRAETAAVAGRRLDVVITCPDPTPAPTDAPTPTPTASPTAGPSVSPTAIPTDPASATPGGSPSASPSGSGDVEPSASASPSPPPSGSVEPSASASADPSASASSEPSASDGVESAVPSDGGPEPSESPSAAASPSEVPAPSGSAGNPSGTPGLASEIPSEVASGAPPGSSDPGSSASPSQTTSPVTGQPPIIVTKINDKGTSDRDDDSLAGGARFEIRLDDGDRNYEPDGDDGGPLVELDAPHGHAVYRPQQPGDYWVKEVAPPPGLTTAPVVLVESTDSATPQNCGVYRGEKRCKPDEDGTGGFTIVVVVDSPKGLPPTDTEATLAGRTSSDAVWWVVAGLLATAAAGSLLGRTARRQR